MNNELVSAVITTCKREPAIVRRAIMSIVNQTYGNLEIIVVDDSPADYAERAQVGAMIDEVRAGTDRPIAYIQHPECRGACAARNTGLAHSAGAFIGYLDDDDEWLPGKVAAMVEKLDAGDAALVYCDIEKYYTATGESKTVRRDKHRGNVFDALLLKNFIGSTSYPLMRKSALEAVGGFDVLMQSAQDYDTWLRIAQKYPVDYVEEVLVRYYVHGGEQITSNPVKRINGLERLLEKYRDYIEPSDQVFWAANVRIIPFYLGNGQRKKAWETWKKCVRRCPGKLRGNAEYLAHILLNR